MKVLTTTMCYPTPDRPDQGLFVYRRAAALAKHFDVQVISPQPWCPLLRSNAVPTTNATSTVRYPRMFSIPVLGWATDGLAYARTLYKEARRSGLPDLIDAHFEYPDGVGAYLAARWLGVPVVVTLRGKLVSLSAKPFRRMQIRAMLRGADGLIAVSESLAELAREIAGRDLGVQAIPNGVDAREFHPVDRSSARAALGWSPDCKYVLCVGHFQRLKGYDRLVSIWPAVRAATGDVRLMLIGSRRGERGFRRQIQHTVAANRLENCVTSLDSVAPATLNVMYAAADLTVNASRSEGWCNAITESLAAGTPVVATDVGGNREQIRSDDLGLVVADNDNAALLRGIVAALARQWDRPLIAARGSARGWDQVASEAAEVFHRVIETRQASPAARPHLPATAASAGGAW